MPETTAKNLPGKSERNTDEIVNTKMEQKEKNYPVEKANGSTAKYTDE